MAKSRPIIITVMFILTGISAWGTHSKNSKSVEPLHTNCRSLLDDPGFHWAKPLFKGQKIHRLPPALFGSQTASLMAPYLKALPKGLEPDESRFFNGIFKTLRDLNRLQILMRNLELDVAEISKNLPPSRTSSLQALGAIFSAYEKDQGLSVEIVDHVLSDSELLALLARGAILMDRDSGPLRAHLSPERPAQEGHWLHRRYTHRLQLHLILRDFKLRPAFYGSPFNFKSLYQRMGCECLKQKLDWSKTGLQFQGDPLLPQHHGANLFFQLFDTVENNGSSPGFYWEYRAYWPMIPL